MNANYAEHVKQCWQFSDTTTTKVLDLDGVIAANIKLKIFEKCLSPFHYFADGGEKQDPKPSEAQIKYAKSLKIKNPENYTKKELSKMIKEAIANE